MDIPNLETLIKVIHCWYGPYQGPNQCKNCPYGYQYYDDTGDTGFWTCDEERTTKETLFFLELYYMVVKENENKRTD